MGDKLQEPCCLPNPNPSTGRVMLQSESVRLGKRPTLLRCREKLPEEEVEEQPDSKRAKMTLTSLPFIGVDEAAAAQAEEEGAKAAAEGAEAEAAVKGGEDEEEERGEEEEEQSVIHLLLLRAKTDTLEQRVTAIKQLIDITHDSGTAQPLFDEIIPMLRISQWPEKLRDRDIFYLIEAFRHAVHALDGKLLTALVPKILVTAQHLLMDDDSSRYLWPGKEIVFNLSKAVGLDAMTAVIEPQMDDDSEYIREAASQALAVVASAVGIADILPFVEGACRSMVSWRVRHTGVKAVGGIAKALSGCQLRSHLKSLVELIEPGLAHKDLTMVTITAQSLTALAEADSPFGFDNFKSVFRCLDAFEGVAATDLRNGEALGALVDLFRSLLPLLAMHPYRTAGDFDLEEDYLRCYMAQAWRLIDQTDEELKVIGLKLLRQFATMKDDYLGSCFYLGFSHIIRETWGRKMALSRRNYKHLIDTTIAIVKTANVADIWKQVKEALTDYSHTYRMQAADTLVMALACEGESDDAWFEVVLHKMEYLFTSAF